VTKPEFGPIVDALAERGMGLFAFDLPSTGEAAGIPLTPGIDQVYRDVIDAIGQRGDVDAERLALWGISFGGNPVVRVAVRPPAGLRAVVNWGGPVHEVFEIRPWQLSLVADMYLDVLRHRIGRPGATNQELADAMRGFSLVEAGFLEEPSRVVTSIPILSVNAHEDYVAPESDLERVTASSRAGELFYSGSDDHCPQERGEATRRTIDWLVKALGSAEPIAPM
jgi:esterase FrsA